VTSRTSQHLNMCRTAGTRSPRLPTMRPSLLAPHLWAAYVARPGRRLHGRPVDLLVDILLSLLCTMPEAFQHRSDDVAPPGGHYTHRVTQLAVRLVVEDGVPTPTSFGNLWRDHRVFVPFATIQNWVEAGEKKAQGQMGSTFSGLGS